MVEDFQSQFPPICDWNSSTVRAFLVNVPEPPRPFGKEKTRCQKGGDPKTKTKLFKNKNKK